MSIKPPIAEKKPEIFETHGHVREDNYYWLREKSNPDVISYLEAENEYTEAVMADTKDLQEKLYQEMKGKIKETDTSAPVKIDNYYYYNRTEEGKEYPIYCRKKESLKNKEEILLDQNELTKKTEQCSLGIFEVSPDHKLLAYSIDVDGSERYVLYIKNLETGKLLPDMIENTYYSLEWRNDSSSFIYTNLNSSMRPHNAVLHILGEAPQKDTELYVEVDERFFVKLSKSKSDAFIFIKAGSRVTTEVYFLDANSQNTSLTLVNPREQEHKYFVEHHDDSFFILTNDGAKNFKLMQTPVVSPHKENWEEVIAHREDVMLDTFQVFKRYLCLYELKEGVISIRVRNLATSEDYYVALDEEIYAVARADNPIFDTIVFRFVYSSLVTPYTVFDYDMDSRERTLVKQNEVLGGYDPSEYTVKRIYAKAEDGQRIPISLAYKKELKLDGGAPCWLYGYGSYGMINSTGFNANRISLLDQGFVFAIAHIRGGGENGRIWYDEGKYLNKKNTFTDFIAVAEELVKEKYTSPSKLVACGRSAGGLLMGAIMNMRPDLFKVVIAGVPFVDVINTIMDATIPLTVTEYEEWGDPNYKEYYEYILSYSPYDNVEKQGYPHVLVTAGLNDPRVHYWEPAKWVSKLRALKTDNNTLLLKTRMGQGHSGASGRYEYLQENAFEYAFVFKILNIS